VRRAFRNQRFANLIPLTSKIKKASNPLQKRGLLHSESERSAPGFLPFGEVRWG